MSAEDQREALLDFDALPVVEIIALLRSLGHHLLACVLDEKQPQLLKHMSSDDARLLISYLGNSPRSGRKLYAHQSWLRSLPARIWNKFLSLIRREKRFSYADTVQQMVTGKLSREAYVARVSDELAHRFELYRGHRIPSDFWLLLGEYAWGDLAFLHDAAESLEREMRSRTLFSADPKPQPDNESRDKHFPTMLLSPQLFWLLLTMAISATLFKRSYRILPARRRTRKAFMLLKSEGLRQGMQPAWANVWDQWVLLEAVNLWGMGKCPESLVTMVENLPLARFRAGVSPPLEMSETSRPEEETGERAAQPPETVQIGIDEWKKEMPGWFSEWNLVRRR